MIKKRTLQLIHTIDHFFTTETFPDDFWLITPLHLKNRLPIYAFVMRNTHHNTVVKALSDVLGIQSRSGISCCSLLAEKLFDPHKNNVKKFILNHSGHAPKEYGFVRLSFNYEFTPQECVAILHRIRTLLFQLHRYTG
jgi:selenocysteine lyase/cysteine desulfurase